MEAVLFDMDGVVVDSEEHWHAFEETELFDRALETGEGRPDLDTVTGMYYGEIYDHLDGNYETVVSKAEFIDLYDRQARTIYDDEVRLMEEFRDFCAELRERGLKVGLVSSSPHDWIDLVRRRFDLEPFDVVLSAEDIDELGKPEPHIYRRAAERLGVDPADCLVVEDSENGVRAAVHAGCFVVGYRAAHNRETDLSEADVVVEGPERLRETVFGRL